ncbi:hypothetical protein DUI87_15345 [Hirundo rustica rustica]|uniref:PX domain-containing protein n=1 Tax=Hirundo rustica rustica TaxID=333673 RepID=A0A3M0K3N2_HIRRU|nr:hypothetical protein DUI87_15345 [Hirundo rustica rustica]
MVCRSLGANPDDLKDPIKISIPRYVLCGQGKDEHYEFEIKITVLDETWTVFRRYSRFRELHKTLKLKYPERKKTKRKEIPKREEKSLPEQKPNSQQNKYHALQNVVSEWCVFFSSGAVILLGRTNMFRFNHPKEAAKLRRKGRLEFERQQREELEKLESKRKQIEEMEEKQKSDKAELVRMQQEVESQRKETEIVQLQIRKQEESLKRRTVHIESRLKDLLAEKEKFEEERLREQQEIELQKKKQQEEIFARVKEELQRLQELNHNEKVEKMQIFRELERLKKEKDEQYLKLELEKKRLEEQEREQVMLVAHLEEQLREKQVMIELLKRGDVQRVEEERRDLEEIRESLLKVKEARSEGDENHEELEKAQQDFVEFKRKQLEQLAILEKDLIQQMDHLEKEIADENGALEHLKFAHEEHLNLRRDDENFMDAILKAEEVDKIKPVEYRLQSKVRQLEYLKSNHLPALLEEKQRASEVLDRGLLGLDNTLYQIEKEIEEKEEQLAQYRASTNQLQQLQETFEFTANVARQEGKVRKKEKEILESREKQQREALEQAVAKLERRHSALQRRSTIDFEIEEQKQKLATLNNSCGEQAGLQASLEAEQKALEQDRERLDQEIKQLKQKIYEGDGAQKGNHGILDERLCHSTTPASPTKPQPPAAPLVDDRINAFIEQEVQRRLQNIHHKAEDNHVSASWSMESFKDNERHNNSTIQRKLKYELNKAPARVPLAVFHEVPIGTIKEIQAGFAGQNIQLLYSAEDGLFTIFTYNKHFTLRICSDIMRSLIVTV